jgi:DNA-binding response OmpR family regulator
MSPIKVLLVDDEVEFAAGLSKVLRRRGFQVEVAADSATGLAMATRDRFDVALLDVKMPGMDGIQLLSEIKRMAPQTQVILMTGHLSMTEETDGLKTGAFAYLLKPHPIPELVEMIRKAVGQGRESS